MGIGPGPQLQPGIGILAFSGGVGQPNVPIGQIPFAQDRRVDDDTGVRAPAANRNVRNIAFNQNGDAVIVRTRDSDGNVRFSASSAGSPMDNFQTTSTATIPTANTGIEVQPGTLNNNGVLGWSLTSSANQTVTWAEQVGSGINLSNGTNVFVGFNADGEPTITTTDTDLQTTAVQASYSTVMTYTDPPGTSEISEWNSTLDATATTVQQGSNAADQIYSVAFSLSDGLTVGASYIPQDAIVPSFTPAGTFNPATVTATQTATISGDWGEFSVSYETKGNADGHSRNAHCEVGLAAVSQGPDPGYGTAYILGSYGQDDSVNAATIATVYSLGGTRDSEYNNFTPVTLGTGTLDDASANTNTEGTTAKLTVIF